MEESQRLSSRSAPPLDAVAVLAAVEVQVPDVELEAKRRALQAVFDAQSDQLKGILRSYVVKLGLARGPEAQDAMLDVYSELYLAAMKTAGKFDLARSGMPWLLRIGFNLVLRQRDEQMRLRKHETPLADLAAAGDEAASADAEAFDRVAALTPRESASTPLEALDGARELLNLVSPADRTVLQLAVIHGLSGDVLAVHLGIAPAAARQRLHRAINRLRVAYDHYLNTSSEARRG